MVASCTKESGIIAMEGGSPKVPTPAQALNPKVQGGRN